jgi:hypothetical protein
MHSRRAVAGVVFSIIALSGLAACGRTGAPVSVAPTTSSEPPKSAGPTTSGPLTAPKASAAQDGMYLTDVTEADPALKTYEQKDGNVALRALLTDGSAFCALLARGGGIDKALVDEAIGARSTESQTHLPLSVTTFNTIEAVGLLRLCPSEQKRVPMSVRTKIRRLGDRLSGPPG